MNFCNWKENKRFFKNILSNLTMATFFETAILIHLWIIYSKLCKNTILRYKF